MKNVSIGVVVGSARKGSYSRIVAETIMGLLPEGFDARMLDITDLPLYNQDFDDEGSPPEAYGRFRNQVRECDAYLFVTPEHNRSVPALLKNALDVASRPKDANAWGGKPGAVVSVSPGGISAFGANHVVRQSMVFLNVYMMQQPEAYIGNVVGMLDQDGKITAEKSVGFLKLVAESFADWIGKFRKN